MFKFGTVGSKLLQVWNGGFQPSSSLERRVLSCSSLEWAVINIVKFGTVGSKNMFKVVTDGSKHDHVWTGRV